VSPAPCPDFDYGSYAGYLAALPPTLARLDRHVCWFSHIFDRAAAVNVSRPFC
jgi:hypothetical protein